MARRIGGIRLRVTLVTVAATLVAMAGVVALAGYSTQKAIHDTFDQSLAERLDEAQAAVEAGDLHAAVDHTGIDLLQVVDAQGNVVASTPNAAGLSAIGETGDDEFEVDDLAFDELDVGALDDDDADADGDRDADADDGDDDDAFDDDAPAAATTAGAGQTVEASEVLGAPGPFQVMRRTVASPDGEVELVAMASLHPISATVHEATVGMAAGLAGLIVLVAAFTWFMTGRTLAPVSQMRREVEAIQAKELGKRVTPPESDSELSALADTFNGLLARIEDSVAEQKRFVSDASHELKSPVAATSLMLETLRDHPESVEDEQVLRDLSSENDRLARIVDDLLALARQDEGRLKVELAPVDYCDLVYEEAAALRQRFPVDVDVSRVAPVIGHSDAALLSHALRNLMENAARYASSQVSVSCCEEGGLVRISVSDDGPGIPAADRERVFGRFERLDGGRARGRGGTGLGLPVARGNVERLGGRVSFGEPELGGATAVVELPAG